MSRVRQSLILQLLDSYLGLALQLASAAVIARLLTPEEIGIFAVAAVLVAMASQFRDFGLGEYLIQERELTTAKTRAAFATNIVVSWSMSLLLLSASWAVADFYRQPGIGEVMRVQAINFLLVPFGAITMAYFRRDLNYRPMFIAGLFANTCTFVVSVGGALSGLSYMSMAWASLAGLVATVAVSVWFRPAELPRWPSLKGVGQVFAFSKHAMGIYFFGQIGKSAPEAVIGHVLDMASVAFFSRANGLMDIFNRTVMRAVLPLCLPYFAQSARAGESTLPGYLNAVSLLTGIGWPFFMVAGALSFSIIRLLFGDQWGAAAQLAQILCIVAVLDLPYWLAKEVLVATGRVDRANLLQFQVQGLKLIGLLLVFPYGLTGACWGLVLASLAGGWVAHHDLARNIGLRFIDLVRSCRGSALAGVAAIAPVLVANTFAQQTHDNYLWFLGLGGASSLLAWLATLATIQHPFWIEASTMAGTLAKRWRSRAAS
jgi:O-antigen/teichoic acid export membrane protein